jgi:hypothetical protein
MISNYISLPIFLVSFAIGLFFVYIIGPETKNIYIYPSPENYMKTQYKDSANQCFEFTPIETQCPINPFSVKTVPIQSVSNQTP